MKKYKENASFIYEKLWIGRLGREHKFIFGGMNVTDVGYGPSNKTFLEKVLS